MVSRMSAIYYNNNEFVGPQCQDQGDVTHPQALPEGLSGGMVMFPPAEEGGEYLTMKELPRGAFLKPDIPDFNDFMYLPYTSDRSSPPPPYSVTVEEDYTC